LETQRNKIGKGRTAEVHFVEKNPDNCMKIIFRGENYTTVVKEQGENSPTYHPLPVEADFLEALRDISQEVRVPKPYFSIVRELSTEEEEKYERQEMQVLVMERLNAVSINDVFEGVAEIPKDFDIDVYFKKLREFFELMHSRKNIHHRDAHAGNLMIDIDDCTPGVLDFGSATYASEYDAYEESLGGRTVRFTKDFDNLDKVERKLRVFLTKDNN